MRIRNRAGKEYATITLMQNGKGGIQAHLSAADVIDISRELKPSIVQQGDDLVIKLEAGPWASDLVVNFHDFKAIKGLLNGSVVKWAVKALFH